MTNQRRRQRQQRLRHLRVGNDLYWHPVLGKFQTIYGLKGGRRFCTVGKDCAENRVLLSEWSTGLDNRHWLPVCPHTGATDAPQVRGRIVPEFVKHPVSHHWMPNPQVFGLPPEEVDALAGKYVWDSESQTWLPLLRIR